MGQQQLEKIEKQSPWFVQALDIDGLTDLWVKFVEESFSEPDKSEMITIMEFIHYASNNSEEPDIKETKKEATELAEFLFRSGCINETKLSITRKIIQQWLYTKRRQVS
jgi:hypothetical protein